MCLFFSVIFWPRCSFFLVNDSSSTVILKLLNPQLGSSRFFDEPLVNHGSGQVCEVYSWLEHPLWHLLQWHPIRGCHQGLLERAGSLERAAHCDCDLIPGGLWLWRVERSNSTETHQKALLVGDLVGCNLHDVTIVYRVFKQQTYGDIIDKWI